MANGIGFLSAKGGDKDCCQLDLMAKLQLQREGAPSKALIMDMVLTMAMGKGD